MTTLTQFPSDEIARVYRCKFCGERFGTLAALAIHKPAPAPSRSTQRKTGKKVKRSLCQSERTMIRAGAWRGFRGVWWTPDRGLDDQTETLPVCASQATENAMVILDKNGNRGSAMSENRKPHNGAGCSGTVSKLRIRDELEYLGEQE